MIRNLRPILLIMFLYCSMILLHLIFSFLYSRSLLFPYAYLSTESNDCILLSSFQIKAVLLISVTTLCFSLPNLCCVFNISFFYGFFIIFLKIIYIEIIFSKWFDICFQVELLLDSVFNLQM